MINEQRPNLVENLLFFPAFEGTMDGGIISKLLRQMIPLASCSCSIDDAVEASPRIGTRPTALARWVKLGQDRFNDLFPEGIGYFPNGGQFVSGSCFHRCQNYTSR